MNRNLSKAFKKTTAGNYFGYCNGYYLFTYRKPHGGWCCFIGRKGEWIWSEGKFTKSLPTIAAVKKWARFYVDPKCTEPYFPGFD